MRADELTVLSLVRERLPPGARLLPTAQPDVSYDVRTAPDESSSGRPHVIALKIPANIRTLSFDLSLEDRQQLITQSREHAYERIAQIVGARNIQQESVADQLIW